MSKISFYEQLNKDISRMHQSKRQYGNTWIIPAQDKDINRILKMESTTKEDKIDMYEIADVAMHAETNFDISYNDALNLFEKDRIIPGYETPVKEIYKGIGKDYGWSDLSTQIFDSFVKEHGEQTIIL